jgi:dienelactone hydrolase
MASEKPKKPKIILRIRNWLSRLWQNLLPGKAARRGAAVGILAVSVTMAAFFGIFIRPGLPGILDSLVGVFVFLVMALLIGFLIWLAYRLVLVLPRFLTTLGFIALLVLINALLDLGFPPPYNILIGASFGLAAAFLGGGIARLVHREFRFARPWKKLIVCLFIGIPLVFFSAVIIWMGGRGSTDHLIEVPSPDPAIRALAAANPSRPGSFKVLNLTYGSEKNKRRPVFGINADLKTESVDATPFVKNNKGWKVKLRHWYWGFDFSEFPVNGTVWYPEGDGPFPLVLIVHGNHKMQEFSDPGYAYLGELLASRGFIFVSVDENFFNGAFMSGLRQENDGRGWMLLQHLKAWREWNLQPGHLFYGKVDMENIGLIGHSRGGEAAAIAAAFNRLPFYPDDATIRFDFDFGIKAVIAIAPSDQQYKPTGRPTPLQNVNFLTLQGAHDSDVSIFAGARQYNRVRFTDLGYWFKATLYSYRSNHGQFNTVWGDSDWGRPMGFVLNRKALLTGEEQRTLGKVYISGFLEATLHGNTNYVTLFRDHRRAADWLPRDIYINRFEDSSFQILCDFEEDVDVTSGTLSGISLGQKDLAVWRESDLKTRGSSTKQNNVVYLGWRGPAEERQDEAAPFFEVELPDALPEDIRPSRSSLLVFSMCDADEKVPEPDEKETPEEERKEAAETEEESGQDEEEEAEQEERAVPPELSIVLEDGRGTAVSLPLASFRPVPPVIKSRFTRIGRENARFGKPYEPTLQTFELPLAEFADQNPDFDPETVRIIRFVFDRGREGVIVLDRIGFARTDPNSRT